MSANKCDVLADKYPETMILQLRGGFYNAFDSSAMVLASVMDYKLNLTETGKYKAGFPVNVINKVLSRFNDCHINTIVFENDKIIESYKFEDNKFVEYIDATLIIPKEQAKVKEEYEISSFAELDFIELICNGKDPYTKVVTNKIDINDARTIRMFYRIRDILRHYQKEGG